MATPTRYDVFLSAVTPELGRHRAELARVLRRKGLHVCEQQDFRQGDDTLIRALAAYIEQCDAVILLVGERSGGLPSATHAASLGEVAQAQYAAYHAQSGEATLSYTQWEYLLAKHYARPTKVYVTTDDFVPDQPNAEDVDNRRRQQAYRAWLRHLGEYTEPLTTLTKLVEDVLVQPFPDIAFAHPANLPLSLAELFEGREEVLGELRQQLTAAAPAGVQASVIVGKALHGLGGVGKTRLALEYGWRYRASYSALLLVAADSPADLDRNLAALCAAPILNLPEQHLTEEARQRTAVLHWLRTTAGWLLVLDNLDTPEARRAAETLLNTQLAGSRGHVLLTSRLGNFRPALRPLELDVLSEAAAAHLLLTLTEGRRRPTPDEQPVARAIARALGRLPLALEQVGAYIATRHITLSAYLAKWQANDEALLAWYDEAVMDYPRSVAATWQTSFDQLGQESPEAQLLLNRLAWLAPDPIPETLLAVPVPNAPPYTEDPAELLAHLTRYSLARQDPHSATFTVHRLVQAVTRQRLAGPEADARLVEALGWVSDAFVGDPEDVRNWPTLDPLLPHALAVTDTTYTEPLNNPQPTSLLLNDVGILLYTKAQWKDAEPLMRRALAIEDALSLPHSPSVAVRLSNLASLLQSTNRLKEAEPLMRRALIIDENSFGPDHPSVSVRLSNLAQLLKDTNRLRDAEPLMHRALAIDEAYFGPNHPEIATDLNNLASLFQATNRLLEAEPLYRRALDINQDNFGPDHPKVSIRLNNLAQLLQATNRLKEAEPLMRRALVIDEASFGPNHPNVASRLNNLAQLLQITNRLPEAEPLMYRALAIDEAIFGFDHPEVARDLNNLASLLQDTNRLLESLPLIRRAFLIFLRSMGGKHPSTQTVGNNYVVSLVEAGHTREQALASVQTLLHEAADQQPLQ